MIELNINKVSSDNIISQTKKAEIKGNNENINIYIEDFIPFIFQSKDR